MHMHVLGRGLATSEHLAIFFVENGWRRREDDIENMEVKNDRRAHY